MGCAQGTGGQLLLEDDATFDADSLGFEFKTENFKLIETVSGSDFIRGKVGRFDNQKRIIRQEVKGGFTTFFSPMYADRLYKRALGGTSSPYTGSNSATEFWACVYRVAGSSNGNRHIYSALKIADITLSGSEGELLSLSIDCLGKTEAVNQTAMPTLTGTGAYVASTAYYPMNFADISQFRINSQDVSVKSFELKITNKLEAKFYDSLTATDICLADRQITFRATMPYSEANVYALYPAAMGGSATAVPVTFTVTNGNCSVLFLMSLVRPDVGTPNITGKTDIDLVWSGEAGASVTGNDEISITTDVTT